MRLLIGLIKKLLQSAKAFSTLTLQLENILLTLFSKAPNKGIDDLIGACYWLKTSAGALNCSRFKPMAALHFFSFLYQD
jgi:hypothetical protein